MHLGHGGLEGEDVLGALGGLVEAGQPEQGLEVLSIRI
jgi:hypothetical protein